MGVDPRSVLAIKVEISNVDCHAMRRTTWAHAKKKKTYRTWTSIGLQGGLRNGAKGQDTPRHTNHTSRVPEMRCRLLISCNPGTINSSLNTSKQKRLTPHVLQQVEQIPEFRHRIRKR